MLVGPDLLFYLSEEFCTTERKILNASICLFQPFPKDQNGWELYEDKPTLNFENHKAILLKEMLQPIFCIDINTNSNGK